MSPGLGMLVGEFLFPRPAKPGHWWISMPAASCQLPACYHIPCTTYCTKYSSWFPCIKCTWYQVAIIQGTRYYMMGPTSVPGNDWCQVAVARYKLFLPGTIALCSAQWKLHLQQHWALQWLQKQTNKLFEEESRINQQQWQLNQQICNCKCNNKQEST